VPNCNDIVNGKANIGVRGREFTIYWKVNFSVSEGTFKPCRVCKKPSDTMVEVVITEFQEGGRNLIPQDEPAFEAVRRLQKKLLHGMGVHFLELLQLTDDTSCAARTQKKLEGIVIRGGPRNCLLFMGE
jgi:hypothetical protein